eukprot:CAMPEP_0195514492 /NCGR_PEP_ID=MMETSP0794_2-20130614/5862_1 /TAXON_ID=515487 /ORGANISM="Stephanopyxis turris, Strain CCMP 815" /LENGTH=484 /DNA_ID=CAMNT_0040642747 /DNA_START=112 /DNA_END=1567 /DNA_ORIENTATION=-
MSRENQDANDISEEQVVQHTSPNRTQNKITSVSDEQKEAQASCGSPTSLSTDMANKLTMESKYFESNSVTASGTATTMKTTSETITQISNEGGKRISNTTTTQKTTVTTIKPSSSPKPLSTAPSSSSTPPVSLPDYSSWDPQTVKFANETSIPSHEDDPSTFPANTNNSSWTPIDGTVFNVRTGPDYSSRKQKAPSLSSLYETVAVRCFKSEKRTRGVTRVLPLPLEKAFAGDENKVQGGMAPDMLVVHFQLPYESPNMIRPKDDGLGGEIVCYLRPTRRFLDEVNGIRPMTPASNLFLQWCAQCEIDSEMRSRFKLMAMVRDIDSPKNKALSWLKPYNGKPTLITASGSVSKGEQGGVKYLEMGANVHKWGFLAKKGFVSLIPRFREMRVDVGFTIEALQNHEMPECMLGSVCINYIDEGRLPFIPKATQVHQNEKMKGGGDVWMSGWNEFGHGMKEYPRNDRFVQVVPTNVQSVTKYSKWGS